MWPTGVTLAWKQGVRSVMQKAFSMNTVHDTYVNTHNHTNIHTFTACRAALEKTNYHTVAYTHSKLQVSNTVWENVSYNLVQAYPCIVPESENGPEEAKPVTGRKDLKL